MVIEAAALDSWVRNVDFMAGSLQPTASTKSSVIQYKQ